MDTVLPADQAAPSSRHPLSYRPGAPAALAAQAPLTSAHIAGASSGVGSTEAIRQSLSVGQLRDIVSEQIAEYAREADRYDLLGQPDAAQRLRHRARILAAYG